MSINANIATKLPLEDQRTPLTPLPAHASARATAHAPAHAIDLESLTRNEQFVYRELQLSDGPQKAYALLDALNDEGLRAPMTIYRALDGLIAKGLAKKITSLNAYAAVLPEARSAIMAYVTCSRCGKTQEVSVERDEIARMLAPTGVALGEVFIEAYGECQNTAGC